MSPGCASVHLRQYFLHLVAGDDYLGHLLLSVSRLPVTFQHTVSHCEGFPLGPVDLVDGPWSLISFHSGHCPASSSRISGPTSLSANCSLLRACWSQPLAAAGATLRALWQSALCLQSPCFCHGSDFWSSMAAAHTTGPSSQELFWLGSMRTFTPQRCL
jgi:hypothetical protein